MQRFLGVDLLLLLLLLLRLCLFLIDDSGHSRERVLVLTYTS
jgi:hypothetical protein